MGDGRHRPATSDAPKAPTGDTAAPNEQPESLPEFLSRRARRASDRRLAADAAAGVLVAAAALIWRPTGWVVALGAATCLGAFGVWGITYRELGERGAAAAGGAAARTLSLRVVRGLATVVGGTAALLVLVSLLGLALGRWIS